jgi:hypothetical protein
MKASRALLIMCLLVAVSASTAGTVTIVDNTFGSTVVNDGTINPGEYVGSSLGINNDVGDVIGAGSRLSIDSDENGRISMGLQSANVDNFGLVVLFIDSKPGGLNSTTTINYPNSEDDWLVAISGDGKNSGISKITFSPDFFADYAIAIEGDEARLYGIGSDGTLIPHGTQNFTRDNLQTWEMDFTENSIGIPSDSGQPFKYMATLIPSVDNLYRSNEFQGVADGSFPSTIGANPVTLGVADYNVFYTVPEPASFALLAVSGAVLSLVRRRRELPHRRLARACTAS